jgi:hypothetical protein|tara:strand:- start:1823 stop:2722 length:900 start_codon:yes stop_codon:yes gene_type:complete
MINKIILGSSRPPVTVDNEGNDRRIILSHIGEEFADGSPAPSMPDEKIWRGSMAASCSRQIAYRITDTEVSNPLTGADYWRFGLGTLVHNQLKPAIDRWLAKEDGVTAIEEAEVELGEHGYGHVDLTLVAGDKKIVVELKTINGTGFKKAIGSEGPRHSALVQGAMYAHASDADLLIICYLTMELCSPSYAEAKGFDDTGRFGAEWHFTKEEFTPIAKAEINRLDWIAENLTEDRGSDTPKATDIPKMFSEYDPAIPWGAEIVDPSNGSWVLEEDGSLLGKGRTWMCNYCNYQDRCVNE